LSPYAWRFHRLWSLDPGGVQELPTVRLLTIVFDARTLAGTDWGITNATLGTASFSAGRSPFLKPNCHGPISTEGLHDQ
jgi:hypothetical protein